MINRQTILSTLSIIGAATLLSSCTAIGVSTADKLIQRTSLGKYFGAPLNLVQNSYAAADYLAHQLQRQYITNSDGIYITRLVNTGSPDLPSNFDYAVAEAIGARFGQLGFATDLSSVNQSAALPKGNKAVLLFTGNYIQEKEYYRMNVQVARIKDRQQVAAFSYMIPRTWDIDKLSEPEAKIIKTTEEATAP